MKNRRPRGYWTKETVVEGIKERYRRGKKINSGEVVKEDGNLYKNGIKVFGTWAEALKESGFNSEDIQIKKEEGTWTKEFVIAEIKRIGKEGYSLNPTNVYEEYGSLYTYGLRLFGGWDTALEASGCGADSVYEVRRPYGYWTKENVIEFLADRYRKGYSISSETINNGDGFGSLYRKAREYHGSWVNVRREVKKYIEEQDKKGTTI